MVTPSMSPPFPPVVPPSPPERAENTITAPCVSLTIAWRSAPAFPPIPGPPIPGPVPLRRTLADISAIHSRILARLGPSPLAEDQLIRDLAMPPSMLSPALMSLELDGKVLRQPGGLLSRID